jgi:hypothetical protein
VCLRCTSGRELNEVMYECAFALLYMSALTLSVSTTHDEFIKLCQSAAVPVVGNSASFK